MTQPHKKRAPKQAYISNSQQVLAGFESPFVQHLDPNNRWVVLAHYIPWDEICNLYLRHVGVSDTGCPPINPRIVIGSLMIKHLRNLDDRETVQQISENVYMQYFIGYASFSTAPPFDASLFVDFRKRLGIEQVNAINERIVELKTQLEEKSGKSDDKQPVPKDDTQNGGMDLPSGTTKQGEAQPLDASSAGHRGRVIYDATACPQNIAYPTDLNLLSDAREKSEELIDILYKPDLHHKKPRTYRKNARKVYLNVAQKKTKGRKVLYNAIGKQLRFLRRNIKSINALLDKYDEFPLSAKEHKYLLVITTLYQQQDQMHRSRTNKIEHRIVSIHQPHIRPIVRGKSQAKVEFGSKIHLSLINGISFLDELSWDPFNEGSNMLKYIEQYKQRFGCYPREVLADKIYCTRENRKALNELGIRLVAKPLGRPKAVPEHVRPGERNPIEGKFGQAKTAYGLDCIKARLKETSETWIACIILVLNLVKLAGAAAYTLVRKLGQRLAILNWVMNTLLSSAYDINIASRKYSACNSSDPQRNLGR